MKRISKLLYLIAAIVDFVGTGSLFTVGLVFTILGAVGVFKEGAELTAEQALAGNLTFVGTGIGLICYAVFFVVAGIIALKGRSAVIADKGNRGIHITNIVFGAITSTALQIAPAVLALILADRKDDRVIDA